MTPSKWLTHDAVQSRAGNRRTQTRCRPRGRGRTRGPETGFHSLQCSNLKATARYILMSHQKEDLLFNKKATKIYIFKLQICVEPDFLHTLEPKQRTVTDQTQQQIQGSSLLNQISKNLQKCKNNVTLLTFWFWKTAVFFFLGKKYTIDFNI